MKLVIVESPTKARKLQHFLGKSYQVESSIGHVRDLPKNKLGIDLEHNFQPQYTISEDKKKVVKQLSSLAKKATQIYLAMDPDREGEAIAWHIRYLLNQALKTNQQQASKPDFHRASFHEITQEAVLSAIDHPGAINQDLVDAQQARRVVDRLVGYQVSPVLWRKIRRGLSAGRVQSVALRLIVEREKEIHNFKPDEYWEIEVALDRFHAQQKSRQSKTESIQAAAEKKREIFHDGKLIENLDPDILVVSLNKINGKKFGQPVFTQEEAKPIIKDLKTADYQIAEIEKKERLKQSYPPFTTSTIQQSAANLYGFSAKQTMRLAQQLYEEGLITYHRTDSFNLSQQAVVMARKYIEKEFGRQYLPESAKFYKSRAKNAQEAHEAIRVTDVSLSRTELKNKNQKFTANHEKLYDLIWRRFVACQMNAALYDQSTIWVKASKDKKILTKSFDQFKSSKTVQQAIEKNSSAAKQYLLKATGSILKFDGWTKLFKNQEDRILPVCQVGEERQFLAINPLQKFTQPPPRYNEASLVKELEQRGIGRPSTYASIISIIQDRSYVEKKDKRFYTTTIGQVVCDFLCQYFSEIMDYDFTAEMEEDLDRISRGEKAWKQVVANFWQPTEKLIKKVIDQAARAKIPVEKTGELCPECGQTEKGEVVIRVGRFGKFKSCSRYPDCKYTENIVEKVEGVNCPLCQQGEVIIKKTRWGKDFFACSRYPACDFASWQQPKPGDKLSQKQWQAMKAKRAARIKKRKQQKTTKK